MKTSEIRQKFLDYFAGKGHEVVASSSLVPHGDPTLMFTNAGMVPFKHVFLGNESRPYVTATSSQKCVRAGGKHNDLDNVGYTARHHTFFEMLGNFSFGDYFKHDAIAYAWEFLTVEMKLDADRLFVTVFEEDDEAYDIWLKEIGIPADKIARIGAKDNFWSMGDTGPCGPCSEIFFDHGAAVWGGPPGTPEEDGDRFIEIWNLVFMQYDRNEEGVLTPLPKPSVDTGMGLERIAAVMQGVHNNYDIDLFKTLIEAACKESGIKFGDNAEADVSLRVLADHLRSVAFLLADGVLPSNEGRGFVLRRILRRACRHGRLLGKQEAFIYKLVDALVKEMGGHFDELREMQGNIEQVVRIEEERFIKTLDKGLKLVEQAVSDAGEGGTIPGKTLFTLYDTFGFPTDLTADILKGRNIGLDMTGFGSCMEEQRKKAREHWKGSGEEAVGTIYHQLVEQGHNVTSIGYNDSQANSQVVALLHDGEQVSQARVGEQIEILTETTPFYGESGGQTGDIGSISADALKVDIIETRKPLPELIVHVGKVIEGTLEMGQDVQLTVDTAARQATALNHTATHILHAVLVEVLGDHVKQAGSLVAPDRLRFDFSHYTAISHEELKRIETEVNRRIRENLSVETREMSADEAIAAGATALFGEKYGERVRVVNMGDFSMELCGGTHTAAAGDIGLFKIIQEAGIAAGVRRIEAATGTRALDLVQQQDESLILMPGLVKRDRPRLETSLVKMVERQKDLERELATLESRLKAGQADDIMSKVVEIGDVKLLVAEVDSTDGKGLREMADKLRDKLGSGVVAIGCPHEGKVNLLVAVTGDLTGRLHAGKLVAALAADVGGRGGGRPDLAQAGGSQPEKLTEALSKVADLVRTTLSNESV